MFAKRILLTAMLLFPLLIGVSATPSAQICGPAQIQYVIRDPSGKVIDPATLKPSNFVGEKANYWKKEPGLTLVKGPSAGSPDVEAKSLTYFGGNDCALELNELTIQIGGKRMHLIFNLSLNSYSDREHARKMIDSLPFAEGTYRLEAGTENQIAASSWKKISVKP